MSEYRNWEEWEQACRMNIGHKRTKHEDRDDDDVARDRAERVQRKTSATADDLATGATEE